ncbi:hypothetical protein R1flu_014370 [Riccia fluitans]|uniref:Uncharacterized protein n=1 Tax=Riccia fluitans TaxID=41844 RepID=A0ABD1YGZ5_9MARC
MDDIFRFRVLASSMASRARVFTVKYDSSIEKPHDHGRHSMRTVVEDTEVSERLTKLHFDKVALALEELP